jgi:hypothetical protein
MPSTYATIAETGVPAVDSLPERVASFRQQLPSGVLRIEEKMGK